MKERGGTEHERRILLRGFRGRHRSQEDTALPTGQYLEDGFPVLSGGPTPRTPQEEWDFSIGGELDEPKRWTWEEFSQLPSEQITRDIHCVTKWSKVGTRWEGVSRGHLAGGGRNPPPSTSQPSATATTPPIYPWRMSRVARLGWPTPTRANSSSQSTAGRRACWCRTCTSGRVPSGSGTAAHYLRHPRLLGDPGLPQLRRPVARAALLGRLRRWLCSHAELSGA